MKTPIYVYNKLEIDKRYSELRKQLGTSSVIYYSMKANSYLSLLKHIAKYDINCEVCSAGELAIALDAGFLPGNIMFGGPGKTREEISYAIDNHINRFSVESADDMQRVNDVALKFDKIAHVLLRINPKQGISAGLSMSGASTQFGIDEEDLSLIKGLIPELGNIKVVGLHIYYGTQIFSQKDLSMSFQFGFDAAKRVSSMLELSPSIIDLGGGFAWPFCKTGEASITNEIGEKVRQLENESQALWPAVKIGFETGRYLVASSGRLYLKVLATKESRGRRFVICDGGINVLGGMAGLGRLSKIDIDVLADSTEETTEQTFVGPLCTPLDVLGRNIKAPKLVAGDIFSIPNVGAYGANASLNNFLHKGPPLESFDDRGEKHVA